MSNHFEFEDKIAFHPGYYIKELVEESSLTQEDFAKRVDTTPKNLSILIRGEQSLSVDIAMKLSRMYGMSISYWLNLQNKFDSLKAEFKSKEELVRERSVIKYLDYGYFRDNFKLPDLNRRIDDQIAELRSFFKIATLTVLSKRNMSVKFRRATGDLTEANVIKANAMVQIAANLAISTTAPRFNKAKFEEAARSVLSETEDHSTCFDHLKNTFLKAGVILVVLPNIPGSKINGATKKIGNSIMLLVNDRGQCEDTFWLTMFHEIGHILNGDFGISFESESGEEETIADRYADNMLIPFGEYRAFVENGRFDIATVTEFASKIGRDPGIVVGRLLKDHKVRYDDQSLNSLRHKRVVKSV